MSLTGCNGTVHAIHGEGDDSVMCTTSSTGGAGGSGGAPTCFDDYPGCAAYITINPHIPWCDQVTPDPTPCTTNPSYVLYNDLLVCVCGDPNNPAVGGTCKDECMNEACGDRDVVLEGPCASCINNTMTGCGNAFNACANDG